MDTIRAKVRATGVLYCIHKQVKLSGYPTRLPSISIPQKNFHAKNCRKTLSTKEEEGKRQEVTETLYEVNRRARSRGSFVPLNTESYPRKKIKASLIWNALYLFLVCSVKLSLSVTLSLAILQWNTKPLCGNIWMNRNYESADAGRDQRLRHRKGYLWKHRD